MKTLLRQQDVIIFIFVSATFYLFTYLAGSLDVDKYVAKFWGENKNISRSFGSATRIAPIADLGAN